MAEGTFNTKDTDKLINYFIFELPASVSMKNTYLGKINTAAEKYFIYKLGIFLCSRWIAYNFSVKQVDLYAYIAPFVPNSHICKITYYYFKVFSIIEFSVDLICNFFLITGAFLNLILLDCIVWYKTVFIHNTTYFLSWNYDILLFKLNLYFSWAIIITAVFENMYNLIFKFAVNFLLCSSIIVTPWPNIIYI